MPYHVLPPNGPRRLHGGVYLHLRSRAASEGTKGSGLEGEASGVLWWSEEVSSALTLTWSRTNMPLTGGYFGPSQLVCARPLCGLPTADHDKFLLQKVSYVQIFYLKSWR